MACVQTRHWRSAFKPGLDLNRSNKCEISEPVVIYQLNPNHAHPKMLIAI